MKELVEALGAELEWRKDTATGIPTGFDAWNTRPGLVPTIIAVPVRRAIRLDG
jgi:hypothetical protein